MGLIFVYLRKLSHAGAKQDTVYLIDFNPYSATTDSLLFDWEEILIMPSGTDPELRLAAQGPVQPSAYWHRFAHGIIFEMEVQVHTSNY